MAIGAKRLVVGAHYGLRDWLVQRATAVILLGYTVVLLVCLVAAGGGANGIGYGEWAAVFAPAWMKLLTLIAILALVYHAWIGMRDVWMDYARPTGIRLGLLLVTILWLLFCALWSAQILWSV
jgi:succinate dehydrogenase / fumarate reductase membrane anchor subunit